jgi:hypothetical protein
MSGTTCFRLRVSGNVRHSLTYVFKWTGWYLFRTRKSMHDFSDQGR